jgi:signal transduction histidine kinase
LRALAIRLEEAREETRTTISQDLHDDVGGNLAGLKIDLMKLEEIASKVSDVEQRNSLMEVSLQSRELINKTIQSARRIMMELRPSVLDDFGLVAALEWQAGEFKTHTSISCQVIAEQEVSDLEKKTATTVFRIFQEALANIARHSGATEVIVRLSSDQEMLVLEVTDNGRGITEGQLFGKESFGLMGMRERAVALGGSIKIQGESGKGTTVTLRVPMRRER